MTNEEILTKAIEKAVKNGYPATITMEKDGGINYNLYLASINLPVPVIFSHDFAKAFWSKAEKEDCLCLETACLKCVEVPSKWERHEYGQESWEVHLMEMVLEKDPIQYLAKFL